MMSLAAIAAPLLAAMLGSGAFGAWLVHKRLSPKSRAEAREITAAFLASEIAALEYGLKSIT